MTKWGLVSIGALAALSSGCAIKDQNVPIAPVLGPGWQCFATASTFDAPGTIFRRDNKNGATFGTIDLSKEIGVKSGQAAIGAVTNNFVTSLGLAANLLRLNNGVTGNASAKLSKTYKVTAEYKDALKETTYDVDADRAKKWFATYSGREAGFTYYLIREAVAAKDLKYIVNSDLIADLGGEATVSQQFTLSLPADSPEANRTRSYTLQKSFEQPLRVCFKAERLVQTASGIDGSATYGLVPVEAPLEISSYKSMK